MRRGVDAAAAATAAAAAVNIQSASWPSSVAEAALFMVPLPEQQDVLQAWRSR